MFMRDYKVEKCYNISGSSSTILKTPLVKTKEVTKCCNWKILNYQMNI